MFDSVAVGEDLALVALTSEILVMLVCKIESKEWHHYIGRSQYPKFKHRPANRANKADDYYSCQDLLFWGKIKTLSAHTIQTQIENGAYNAATIRDKAVIQTALLQIDSHCDKLSGELKEAAALTIRETSNISSRDIDIKQLTTIYNMALEMFESLIPIEAKIKLNKFKEHLWLQLKKGGGTLHKYISKVDKAYMNVDYTLLSKNNVSPEPFLEQQCDVFGKFWCPKMSERKYRKLLQNLRDFRKHAISQVDSSQRTPCNYKNAIHSYKKTLLEEIRGRYQP